MVLASPSFQTWQHTWKNPTWKLTTEPQDQPNHDPVHHIANTCRSLQEAGLRIAPIELVAKNIPAIGSVPAVFARRTMPSAHVLSLSPQQRYETVERRSYCRNCLARSHLAPDCSSLSTCRKCNVRHHTLLHDAPQTEDPQPPLLDVTNKFTWDLVFVPTAMVRVMGTGIETYATLRSLINQASVMSRISYSSFRRLGLRSFLHKERRFTTFKIMGRNTNDTWALKVNALITNELPYRPYDDPIIEDPAHDIPSNRLADVDPRGNTPIEIELGGDTYSALRREGRLFTGLGDVYAYETAVGFVLSGPIKNMPRT